LEVPLSQEVFPVLQGVLGVQVFPAVQGTQFPLLQTWFVPHIDPFGMLEPLSLQTGLPLLQERVPAWHLFDGVHVESSLHASQVPSWQTRLFPQGFPLSTFAKETQLGAPVMQSIFACLQGWSGRSHDIPAVQATHSPPGLQTLFAPHWLPADFGRPESLHDVFPPEQSSVPS
jgi:hypothetical protein